MFCDDRSDPSTGMLIGTDSLPYPQASPQDCDAVEQNSAKSSHERMMHAFLPERNTQAGSPMNTFTASELEELRKSLPAVVDAATLVLPVRSPPKEQVHILKTGWASHPDVTHDELPAETWHGAPDLDAQPDVDLVRRFRDEVRSGRYTGPTNGRCPGFLQCNMVVLRQGQEAFDFLLFCQRNKQACPLIEVCDVGSPHPEGIARGADLRTDIPKYAIYKDGSLHKEVTDATEYWPKDSVAFLIGCSFSVEGALTSARIPLRSAEQGKNVPMYRSNLPCRSSGSLHGNMVVSMKPVKALDISKVCEITSKYPQAHGVPVCIGCPESIGIDNLNKPDWGDAVEVMRDELPVFHACGVTPQNVLMMSGISFAITHSAGHMFVSDLPSDATL